MDILNAYDSYILIGQEETAQILYRQLSEANKQLVAVVDVVSNDKRKITDFNGYTVINLKEYKNEHDISNVAIVVAVNDWFLNRIVNEYGIDEKQLFVINPYVSLRTFMRTGEVLLDARIPFSDERYRQIGKLFQDELSCAIFKELIHANPWDSFEDDLELKWYPEIKSLFFMREDYWDTYSFKTVSTELATVVDCGAYTGDCILKICDNIPQKIVNYYAIEPLHENATIMRGNKELASKCVNLEVIECGVGNRNSIELFRKENDKTESGRFVLDEHQANDRIAMKRLDDMGLEIIGQLFLKMDVEGGELSALQGASEIIRKYKPYCAVCVYHRKNDIVTIPLLLKKLVPDYHFYLRGGYHTIVWAVPPE